jgi:hypothetical protein
MGYSFTKRGRSPMSTVQEIERAIGKLSPQEVDELHAWMEEQFPQPIDAQLKADLDAGRMDAGIRSALAEHKAGSTRAL